MTTDTTRTISEQLADAHADLAVLTAKLPDAAFAKRHDPEGQAAFADLQSGIAAAQALVVELEQALEGEQRAVAAAAAADRESARQAAQARLNEAVRALTNTAASIDGWVAHGGGLIDRYMALAGTVLSEAEQAVEGKLDHLDLDRRMDMTGLLWCALGERALADTLRQQMHAMLLRMPSYQPVTQSQVYDPLATTSAAAAYGTSRVLLYVTDALQSQEARAEQAERARALELEMMGLPPTRSFSVI
jgi:hypothetical protein